MPVRTRPIHRVAVAALAIVVLTAATRQTVPVRTYDATHPSVLNAHYLTRDAGDAFAVRPGPGAFRVDGPTTNRGTNTRMLLWPYQTPMSVDQQVCSTWTDQRGISTQQGVALRIRRDVDGRFRAITVMKNITWGANWGFNVLTWDSADPAGFRVRGAVLLPGVFYRRPPVVDPLPWRLCARVEGNLVTVKAWRIGEPEPAWGDRTHGAALAIDPAWTYAGKAGFYIGHLQPGGTAGFSQLSTATIRS